MNKIRFLVTALASLVLCAAVYAQDVSVSGVVTDASSGEPVPFATIQIKGTLSGGSTDAEGNYSILVEPDAVLIFSSIGYVSQEVGVDGRARLDIRLAPDAQMLEETIVVAFGTATKESFTGSATVVESSDISKVQSSNPTRALEGLVAGVQMTTSSGALGSSPSIRIRGASSINAGTEPLYIVDGVPYSGDLNNLNSNDIESMTVLKDAASNALYGARGANGVIMITTKKAKAGRMTVNLDAKWGWNSKALKNYDYITDPAKYYETHYAALYNYYVNEEGMTRSQAHLAASENVTGPSANGGLGYQVYTVPEGQTFIGPDGKINPAATLGKIVNYNGNRYLLYPDNWMDETYHSSLRQEYNVSLSGSTGDAQIFASFGYLNNKGIIDGSDMYRYSARLRIDYQVTKWLKFGANTAYTNFNWDNGNSGEGGASTGNVFSFAASMAPVYPLYIRDASGNIMIDQYGLKMYDYGDGGNAGMSRPNAANSNALQSLTLDVNNSEGNAINGSAYVTADFLKDFSFTFNIGLGLDETRSTSVQNSYYGQFAPGGGAVSKSHSRSFYLNMQQLLSYDKTIKNDHHINVMLGHENYVDRSYGLGASKTLLFSMSNTELDGAVLDGQSASSSKSVYNNEGYFARAQYDYRGKVYASVSYRRDASSRFHPDHRWGNFWSLGAGWLINEEPWFRAPWVDMLKLKASIGSQGNDNIGDYLYVDVYEVSNSNGELGIPFVRKGNPDITWETNTNFNAGVDFDLFRGRLSGSAEYFYRLTSDMLFFFPLPMSNGYDGKYDNIGDMRNSGIEVGLNGTLIDNSSLRWDMNLNFTHYTNKVVMIPDENKSTVINGHGGYASGNKFIGEGLPLNTFYMRKYAGVNRQTGESMWYKDVTDSQGNPTGQRTVTTSYDEATQYLCDDPTPKLYGGFGTSLSFFGFDVSAQFTYSIGGLTYDSGYATLMNPPGGSIGNNYHKDVLKAWTPENPDSDIPRWQYNDQNVDGTSDRFLIDASYLNFQNAQIGYTFPEKITRKLYVSRLRVYVSCDNIVYWSRRSGLDPRYSFDGSTNNLVNSPVRTLSGGLNITF